MGGGGVITHWERVLAGLRAGQSLHPAATASREDALRKVELRPDEYNSRIIFKIQKYIDDDDDPNKVC
jgi:hypothetical protein